LSETDRQTEMTQVIFCLVSMYQFQIVARLVCFHCTNTSYSALGVLHTMRYINLRDTYLLTMLIPSHTELRLYCHLRRL